LEQERKAEAVFLQSVEGDYASWAHPFHVAENMKLMS